VDVVRLRGQRGLVKRLDLRLEHHVYLGPFLLPDRHTLNGGNVVRPGKVKDVGPHVEFMVHHGRFPQVHVSQEHGRPRGLRRHGEPAPGNGHEPDAHPRVPAGNDFSGDRPIPFLHHGERRFPFQVHGTGGGSLVHRSRVKKRAGRRGFHGHGQRPHRAFHRFPGREKQPEAKGHRSRRGEKQGVPAGGSHGKLLQSYIVLHPGSRRTKGDSHSRPDSLEMRTRATMMPSSYVQKATRSPCRGSGSVYESIFFPST